MITIGIRAAPRAVTFAIYDSEAKAVVNVEDIKIPAAFTPPEGLKYLRSNVLDVLREYRVECAGIRATESTAAPNVERIQKEAVIQEAFASSELKSYYVGQIANISKRLGIDRASFKPLVAGEQDFGVENWLAMNKEEREAILSAIGAASA